MIQADPILLWATSPFCSEKVLLKPIFADCPMSRKQTGGPARGRLPSEFPIANSISLHGINCHAKLRGFGSKV